MTERPHQPCPYVDCGSSDAFSYNDKGYGWCHSCARPYPSKDHEETFDWVAKEYPLADRKKPSVQLKDVEVSHADHEDIRGLHTDVAKLYGIQGQYDAEGVLVRYAFKHPNGNIKYRSAEDHPDFPKKTFQLKSKGALEDLFGSQLFNKGTSKRVYVTEGECFEGTAQVLTRDGWKSFEQLNQTEEVYQVNEDQTGGFVRPLAYIRKEYEGDLIEYSSRSYWSRTTAGHQVARLSVHGDLEKRIATSCNHLRVPRVILGTPGVQHVLPDTDVYRLAIMLSADFTFRESGDIYGAFKKDRKILRAKTLLDKLSVRYSLSQDSNGYTSFFIHRGHGYEWIRKELPQEILGREDRLALLEEIIEWDGHRVGSKNQSEYYSNLQHNVELVQTLSHLCGYTSSIIRCQNEHGCWSKVSILYGKTYSTTQMGYSRVPYKGLVYCVTVPSGYLLVRQRESISISGNCDAASVYQMLGKTFPAVSLPNGGTMSRGSKEKIYEYLKGFQEVVWAGDNDDVGRAAADTLYQLFPEKFYKVSLTTHKDANEYLMAGKESDFKWAALKPQRYTPENFFTGNDTIAEDIRSTIPYEYVKTPHQALNEKIRGLVKGGLTIIKAPSGLGKTTWARYFEVGILENSKKSIAFLHMEESRATSWRGLATAHLKANVMTQEDAETSGYTEAQVITAAQEMADDRVVIFEMLPSDGPAQVEEYIRLAATVFGCEYITLDHGQRLAYLDPKGMADATNVLSQLAARLAQLSKELNIGIIILSQVNDEGLVKLARSIVEEAIVVISLDRDKEAEDDIERNTTSISVEKNRPFGTTGAAGSAYYDPETTLLEES